MTACIYIWFNESMTVRLASDDETKRKRGNGEAFIFHRPSSGRASPYIVVREGIREHASNADTR